MGIKDIENFKASLNWVLHTCENVYLVAKENNLLDEQYVLDWLDSLNEISTRH